MKSLGLAVFFVAVAVASAGLHAGWGGSAVIAGPAGTVVRSGLTHGAVIAPGVHGLGLGLGLGAQRLDYHGGDRRHHFASVTDSFEIHGNLCRLVRVQNTKPCYGMKMHADYIRSVIAPGIIGAGHGLIGSGIEGQYIHDYTETLYDDGSYKPHVYGH